MAQRRSGANKIPQHRRHAHASLDPGCIDRRSDAAKAGLGCTVCAKVFYKPRDLVHVSLVEENAALYDFDVGLYELISRITEIAGRTETLEPRAAARIAQAVTQQSRRVRLGLIQQGLLHSEEQSFSGDYAHARMMAPFHWDELVLGPLLGTGGFSSAYAVDGFRLNPHVSVEVNSWEQAARAYLTESAMRTVQTQLPTGSTSKKLPGHGNSPRYVVKYLRHALIKDVERFERAAMDLNLESQLLLAMDHPNIISIRGWTRWGPSMYTQGQHNGFFIILDLLPETLEDRIMSWRTKLRKYRSRCHLMPWAKTKFFTKIGALFLEQVKAAYDISCALEYMHDRRLINRDVKSSNIGFDVHGDLKLFDFGLSRVLPRNGNGEQGNAYFMSRVGTKYYMAPEVRHKEPYNLSADVYSFGVVLWEIFAMGTPREVLKRMKQERSRQGSKEEVSACTLPMCSVCWPATLRDLIQSCWSDSPNARPTMSQVRYILHQQLNDMGIKAGDRKRRGSSFRLDMSQVGDFSMECTSQTSSMPETIMSSQSNVVDMPNLLASPARLSTTRRALSKFSLGGELSMLDDSAESRTSQVPDDDDDDSEPHLVVATEK